MDTAPSTPPRKRLTRDQRRDILLMRRLGYTYKNIADFLHVSQRAVQYTVEKQKPTPQHSKAGRPPRLNKEEADRIEQFVTSSQKTRRMTYKQIAEALWPEGEVGHESVKSALHKRGYRRRIALRKPPLSEANKAARLQWALEHENWTVEQWSSILWSDETWVKAGRHRKTFVTRKPGEEFNPTCVLERVQRQSGWMFWGSFHGSVNGPCLFWEKDWGSINQTTYCERIVPIVDGYLRMNPTLVFMQDNAPGHAAQLTQDELKERGVNVISWPAFSPDLNPIEAVWNEMKNYLSLHYPDKKATYDVLRRRVREAWDQISPEFLHGLILSMQDRCKAVIEAQGGHTPY